MKTKFLFKLLATISMLVITLALSNVTVFAEDAPPSIPDPFGGTDGDAPPSLELTGGDEDAPPSLELNDVDGDVPPSLELNGTGGTSGPGGPSGSGPGGSSPGGSSPGGSGGSPTLLNKKTKTPAKVTDLDKDGDIDTNDEILFQQQQEQDITETGPEIVYVLLLGLILNGVYFTQRKKLLD